MSYASYVISGGVHDGEQGGYAVETTCDHEGCGEDIDRGLAYLCGDSPGGGEDSCGGYFCGQHRYLYGVSAGGRCDGCVTDCPTCDGEGVFHEERSHSGGDVADLITGTCERCDGRGLIPRDDTP